MTPPAKEPQATGGETVGENEAAQVRVSNRVAGISPPSGSEIARMFPPKTKPTDHPTSSPEDKSNNPTMSKEIEADIPTPVLKPMTLDDINDSDDEPTPEPLATHHDDPDPAPKTASKAVKAEKTKELREYGMEMYNAYRQTEMYGKRLWLDFCSAFRPHTIKAFSRAMTSLYIDLLISRDVYVEEGRDKPRNQAVIDILFRDNHINTMELPMLKSTRIGQRIDKDARRSTRIHEVEEPTKKGEEKMGTRYEVRSAETKGSNSINVDGDDGHEDNKSMSSLRYKTGSIAKGDPNPGDSGSDSSSSEEEMRRPHKRPAKRGSHDDNADEIEVYKDKKKALGIHGLMKAYQGQKTFGGNWDEDLDRCLAVFGTLSKMCECTESDKLQALPVMLTGDALSYYALKLSNCGTFTDAAKGLQDWYNSDEKRARVLTAWQSMTLSDEMGKAPEKTEVEVFRLFVAKLVSLQQQLDATYHEDSFLRDRLLTSVDISRIQTTLRDRPPRNSQQAVHRIANQLSDKPNSAGSSVALLIDQHDCHEDEYDDQAYYSLGKTYDGEARNAVKTPWKRAGYRGRSRGNGRYPDQGSNRVQRQGRRLAPNWMRGVRGCFVCGQNHRANTRHSKEEVTKAINRLKARHPSALLSIEDLAAVMEMTQEDTQNDTDDDEVDNVQWMRDSDEQDEESDTVYLMNTDKQQIEEILADNAFIHGRTLKIGMNAALAMTTQSLNEKTAEKFDGIKLDTCANRSSVISHSQYISYVKEFGLRERINSSIQKRIRGIGGVRQSIGIARIQIPFIMLNVVIDVDFLVLSGQSPTVLSMRDMVDNGLEISIQEKWIKHKHGNATQPLHWENYFLIHRWKPDDHPFVLYTEAELRRIHRGFGHPSINATQGLLERAEGKKISQTLRQSLTKISNDCKLCNKLAAKPRRFKLTVGTSDMRFNHQVIVDTMFLDSKPVIHIIDEATHFTSACFLPKQTTKEIWKAIRRMWTLIYMGPPDFLNVDQGSAYTSKEMRELLASEGVQLKEAPIESPGAIGIVERYHAPLRAAYTKVRQNLDRATSDAECLAIAVYSVNCTMGPEGLCPMLLVFGALPRPARIRSAPRQIERANAIDTAKTAVEKEQARSRLKFALRHPSCPKGKEASEELRHLPAGAPVLIYRNTTKDWQGPFRFISIEGETVVVQLNRGRRIFRSTHVRPMTGSILQDEGEQDEISDQQDRRHEHSYTTEDLSGQKAGKVKVRKGSEEERMFRQARKTELNGLLKDGTFEVVDQSTLKKETRIFGSRFIDEIKRAEAGLRRKSRLVAHNYADVEAGTIATKAPTVQRFAQRMTLSIAASLGNTQAYTRDITQAYIQATSNLERHIYIRPPKELNLPNTTVLRVVKPLYGVPESGLHWYVTYLRHHEENLGMTKAKADPCVLMKHNKGELDGLIILQVDDSLGVGSSAFLEIEERESLRFRTKPRRLLSADPISFNGINVKQLENGTISIDQSDKIDKVTIPINAKQFASERALAQYVGVNSRPDFCAPVQLLAPGNTPTTTAQYKEFEKAVRFMKETKDTPMNFIRLDLSTTRLVLMTDASFANAQGSKSQLGYLILMVDNEGNSNIIHWGSNKCKRIARSVMAAEVHALVLGFDYAFVIRNLLSELLKRDVSLEAMVDSKTLFNVVAKDGTTSERRLQIDVLALRESYEKGELQRVGWIPGTKNPADALTKPVLTIRSPLYQLMTSNKLTVEPTGWSDSRKS